MTTPTSKHNISNENKTIQHKFITHWNLIMKNIIYNYNKWWFKQWHDLQCCHKLLAGRTPIN